MINGRNFTNIWIDEMVSEFSIIETNQLIELRQVIIHKLEQRLNDPMYDNKFVSFIKDNCVLSGGAIASHFHNEEPNDYDLYFKTEEALKQFNTLMDKNRIRNLVKDVNPNYMSTLVGGKLVTQHATTMFNDVQIITMGTKDMLSTFDFLHCKPYVDLSENRLYISKKQLASIRTKTIVLNTPNFKPYRILKYEGRGWKLLKTY